MVMPVGDEREQKEFVRLSPLDQVKQVENIIKLIIFILCET